MKKIIQLTALLTFLSCGLLAEDEKQWHGFVELAIEHDSNPQQYGDTAIATTTDEEDLATSLFLNFDYNYDLAPNWIARHVASFYEIRYNDHEDLNFRALSFSEDIRTPLSLFNRKGYIQNRLQINHYSLDNRSFLWGGKINPEISLMHLDQQGVYRFGVFIDRQNSISTQADDFEGNQIGLNFDVLRKFNVLQGSILKVRTSFSNYDPSNATYAYDQWAFDIRYPILIYKDLDIKFTPYSLIYDRSYDSAASNGREDDGIEFGLSMQFEIFKDFNLNFSGSSVQHNSNATDESYDKEVFKLTSSYAF